MTESEMNNQQQCDVLNAIKDILAHSEPSACLLEYLSANEARPDFVAGVFEAAAGQIKITHYWAYYVASRAYFSLGRDDACFLAALAAIQMEPTYPNWHMYYSIYKFHLKRNNYATAAGIILHQVKHTPEIPIVSPQELRYCLEMAGIRQDEVVDVSQHVEAHCLAESSAFRLRDNVRYGIVGADSKCHAIDQYRVEHKRPSVIVWEIKSPKVVIFDNNLLVYAQNGQLLPAASVCEYPEALHAKITLDPSFADLPNSRCDAAAVVVDKYTTPNVCHFLLDHMTRLALYERLCPLTSLRVIGGAIKKEFQQSIISKIGVEDYVAVDDRLVLYPTRLFVSETCKDTFVHPAHFAADWATGFLRARFDVRTQPLRKGRRIYISREDAAHRFVRNEDEVCKLLMKYDFEKIVLTNMCYAAQQETFSASTHVIGMHGAGLTNIVFLPPGAFVLEVCHPVGGTAAYAIIASGLDVSFAAMVGRDAETDDAAYNDPEVAMNELGMGGIEVASNRDVTVDILELERWLKDSGVAS